jgi:hypothetical protein
MENLNDTDKTSENADKELRISDVMCSLPTDEFLSKHLYKTDALLKFGIKEIIHKKDLSRTQLIGVLEYITNLRQ